MKKFFMDRFNKNKKTDSGLDSNSRKGLWHFIKSGIKWFDRNYKKLLHFLGASIKYVLLFVFLMVLFSRDENKSMSYSDRVVLHLKLDNGVVYKKKKIEDGFSFFQDNKYSLKQIIKAIKRAENDDRVRAILIEANSGELDLTMAYEINQALLKFNSTGKRSIFYSKSLGNFVNNGTLEYYIASHCSEIWMSPTGEINLLGVRIERPYIKEALNKIGVSSEFSRREEYKRGFDTFVESSMSNYERESLGNIADYLYDSLIKKISENRNIEIAKIKNIINNAPITSKEAYENHLIDRLAYRRVLRSELKETTDNARLFNMRYYKKNDYSRTKKKVAYFNLNGMIVDDAFLNGDGDEGNMIVSSDIVKALEKAKKDEVDAVFIHINSPGGIYQAADEIWEALVDIKTDETDEDGNIIKKGIPVVVKMNDIAASGGYYVAMAADKIVASPYTLTGSIGVYAGKAVFKEMWRKIGVNWDSVERGDNASFLSANQSFSANEKNVFNVMLDRVYNDFVSKFALSRGVSLKEASILAKGQVYIGSQALDKGLVDKVGTDTDAVLVLKNMLGLKETDNISFMEYHKNKFKNIIDSSRVHIKSEVKNYYLKDLNYIKDLKKYSLWFKILNNNISMVTTPIELDL